MVACREMVLVGRVEVEVEVETAFRRTGTSGGGIRACAGVDLESNEQRKEECR